VRIERLPGGHLTTNPQPEALAALIADFEGRLSGIPRRSQSSLRCLEVAVPVGNPDPLTNEAESDDAAAR
jgi:hypothetical protein